MIKMESSTYFALVSGEAFVDLKPALEKYGQNLLKTIPQQAWDAVTVDGKIYAIPEVGFGQMRSSALVWNRRQLQEVGISKIPETMEEVERLSSPVWRVWASRSIIITILKAIPTTPPTS